MDTLAYQPHEAKRHTAAIRETVQRSYRSVFTGPNLALHVKDGPWFFSGPSEQVTVRVYQKTGCCGRRPICTIQIDRPKADTGLYKYTRAAATLLEASQHAGSVRFVGHLQRQCPFLPKFEVTMAYEFKA